MLTEEEKQVGEKLAEAWNLFVKLPVQHSMDNVEFMHAIHQAQYLVVKRSTVREHPEIYTNENEEKTDG